MSENKKLALLCFGIVGAITLSLETCAYFGRLQHQRQLEYLQEYRQAGQKRVQQILDGPETAQVTLTIRGRLEIPSTVRVVRTGQTSKHYHSIVIEGPKKEMADFLSQYYGLNGQRD